jgi:DNA-directed RNA polymerase specialized sigma24 family protein
LVEARAARIAARASWPSAQHVAGHAEVQETLLRAWRGIDGFEGRSSARSLYRIATYACLDLLRARPRREMPMEDRRRTAVAAN